TDTVRYHMALLSAATLTGQPAYQLTGLPADPLTGLPADPLTGLPADPLTGGDFETLSPTGIVVFPPPAPGAPVGRWITDTMRRRFCLKPTSRVRGGGRHKYALVVLTGGMRSKALSPQQRDDAIEAMASQSVDVVVIGGGVDRKSTRLNSSHVSI